MKRMVFAVMTAALVAFPVLSSGHAHAEDYAEGWINLFDGETLFGLQILGDPEWEVRDGALTCRRGTGGWIATTGQWGDFELTMRVRVAPNNTTAIVVRSPLDGHPSENGSVLIPIQGPEEGYNWQWVGITATGNAVSVQVDGEDVTVPAPAHAIGYIGVLYQGARVEVADIKLRPLSMEPIFDGETLDGWNIIPDRQSEFRVDDGALRVLDGPGQIETDELYKNFVLQMDIFSNGDHLNSGVFFRGPKGVFWRGYEAQVRNEWREERTRPHDFGTGGIYAIQPARVVVSSDYEWFHMTILCNDNHFAVWVNGHAVADFLDMRPRVDHGDAKVGYVGDAGTIHLQGHDPATDLSFKNINIQEYPSGD